VVAILGILAAVIIPNVSTFMATGKLNAARTEAENVKTAALAYYADYSSWPASGADLTAANRNYVSGSMKGVYAFGANGKIAASSTYSNSGTTFTFDNATTVETWIK
jgi:type II secretory pathway pseudopilin PulG